MWTIVAVAATIVYEHHDSNSCILDGLYLQHGMGPVCIWRKGYLLLLQVYMDTAEQSPV